MKQSPGRHFIVNPKTGKERPVARDKILSPIGEVRMDGWHSLITGLGTSSDKRLSNQVTWTPYTMEFYEQLYSGDELAARIVDIVPEDALRKWLEPQGYPKHILKLVEQRLASLNARQAIEKSWKWARAFGGSLLHVVTDGVDPSQPLDPKKEQVIGLRDLSRYDLRILTTDIETDFGSENFGYPNIYYLNVQMGTNVKLYPIHWSRCIRFDGKLVPRRTFIRNNYWHDSELQRLYNVIRNYQTSNDAAAAILQDFNTGVFKLKDLANFMSSGKEQLVKNRIEMINYAKSTIRAMLLDADSEEFVDMARNVTGLPEMLDHQARRFVAATDIPHTKLLGESPDGSNATGNSTTQMWREKIEADQNNYLRPKINRLFSILFWDMPELSYKFNELQQLTKLEEADLRNKTAQTDQIYLDQSVLDPSEVAKSRFGGEAYSIETELDIESRKAGLIGQPHEHDVPPELEEGEQDEPQGGEGDGTPGKRPAAKQDGEAGDFPLEEGSDEPASEAGAGGAAGGEALAEEEEFNPWEEYGEEEEMEVPESLREHPLNPKGSEIPRQGGSWSPRNNEIPSRTDKATPFITQTESLPFRDPKTDPRMPPPGRKPVRIPDYDGKYSAAGGSQKPADQRARMGGELGNAARPSVAEKRDAGESSLMPRSLDFTKGGKRDSKLPDIQPKSGELTHGVSVVVMLGNQVLLGKRRDTGAWALPGGRMEPGETPKISARRELFEETMISIAGSRLMPLKSHQKPEATVSTFLLKLNSAPPFLDASRDPDLEFTELRWVDVSEGLPAEIAGNLHHEPNLALLDVGLGKSST